MPGRPPGPFWARTPPGNPTLTLLELVEVLGRLPGPFWAQILPGNPTLTLAEVVEVPGRLPGHFCGPDVSVGVPGGSGPRKGPGRRPDTSTIQLTSTLLLPSGVGVGGEG